MKSLKTFQRKPYYVFKDILLWLKQIRKWALTPIDKPQAFDEILYVLMNGTGVGFSVERQFVSHLPTIADEFHMSDTTIIVQDTWQKQFP